MQQSFKVFYRFLTLPCTLLYLLENSPQIRVLMDVIHNLLMFRCGQQELSESGIGFNTMHTRVLDVIEIGGIIMRWHNFNVDCYCAGK